MILNNFIVHMREGIDVWRDRVSTQTLTHTGIITQVNHNKSIIVSDLPPGDYSGYIVLPAAHNGSKSRPEMQFAIVANNQGTSLNFVQPVFGLEVGAEVIITAEPLYSAPIYLNQVGMQSSKNEPCIFLLAADAEITNFKASAQRQLRNINLEGQCFLCADVTHVAGRESLNGGSAPAAAQMLYVLHTAHFDYMYTISDEVECESFLVPAAATSSPGSAKVKTNATTMRTVYSFSIRATI